MMAFAVAVVSTGNSSGKLFQLKDKVEHNTLTRQ